MVLNQQYSKSRKEGEDMNLLLRRKLQKRCLATCKASIDSGKSIGLLFSWITNHLVEKNLVSFDKGKRN